MVILSFIFQIVKTFFPLETSVENLTLFIIVI